MKANGVVRRLVSNPPGIERWEAQCLLCAWRSPGTDVCLQERSRAGDWDALEGYSQVEPEEALGRRARTVSRQRLFAWFWHAIHSREILRVTSGFIDAWNLSFFAPPIASSSSPTAAFYLPG